jgi:hypothetical protein
MKLILKSGWVECKINAFRLVSNEYQYDVEIHNYVPEQVKKNVPESELKINKPSVSSFSLTTQQQPYYPKKVKCKFGSSCRLKSTCTHLHPDPVYDDD